MNEHIQKLHDQVNSLSNEVQASVCAKAISVLHTIPNNAPYPSIEVEGENIVMKWKTRINFRVLCYALGYKVKMEDSPAIIIEQDYPTVTSFGDIIRYYYRTQQ